MSPTAPELPPSLRAVGARAARADRRVGRRPGASPRERLEDEALVVRRIPYGDSSLVLALVTRRHGRLRALAKGAYRPKSRYCGVFDLFDTLRVTAARPRGEGLALVTEATLERRRRAIPQDLRRYRVALSVLELGALGAREGEGDPRLFGLLEQALDQLATGAADPSLVRVAFDLSFLVCMGLNPALERCAACGRPPEKGRGPRTAFSSGAGGRLCPACGSEARASGRRVEEVPWSTLRVARSLLETPLQGLARVHVAAPQLRGVDALVQRFLEYHLETRPRTRRMALDGPTATIVRAGTRRPAPPAPRR